MWGSESSLSISSYFIRAMCTSRNHTRFAMPRFSSTWSRTNLESAASWACEICPHKSTLSQVSSGSQQFQDLWLMARKLGLLLWRGYWCDHVMREDQKYKHKLKHQIRACERTTVANLVPIWTLSEQHYIYNIYSIDIACVIKRNLPPKRTSSCRSCWRSIR